MQGNESFGIQMKSFLGTWTQKYRIDEFSIKLVETVPIPTYVGVLGDMKAGIYVGININSTYELYI